MTGLAGHPVRVHLGCHLREVLRPSRAGRVASYAQHGGVQFGRCHGGIGGMRRQGAVAGFAVHPFVLSLVLDFSLIRVAGLASLVAGKFGGMRRDLVHGGSAVVPVLAEGLGNDESANSPEEQESDNKQACKSEKMSRISENVHSDQASRGGGQRNAPRRLM